ncbi:class C sortase [Leucobacter coleopterorum]|uniref:Class C sortase n=1 Tax=Leucobacter coleopterorum TaxID=2714933 RepID=A0ABX6K0L7_9MICO|nr:class C sortase [Leucobacter coleopterorum]QIM18787.1 class C sortase [Leucobacter coleopterorum]
MQGADVHTVVGLRISSAPTMVVQEEVKMNHAGGPRTARRAKTRRQQQIALMITAVVGAGVMLYPMTASWFTANAQSGVLAAYANKVQGLPEEEKSTILTAAENYNQSLPVGDLQDPYTTSQPEAGSAAVEDYFRQLNVPGTDSMAQLDMPSLRISLPIYHGTSARTLDRGVGHFLGSSLPVGGPGTHSVVTAHSGIPEAAMFTKLSEARLGDVFSVTAVGRKLYYKVDQILVVKPDDLSALRIVPGKDYLTLITCTPINVNSHRLLVRGERIAVPESAAENLSPRTTSPFPWWILVFVGVLAVVGVAIFVPNRLLRRLMSRRNCKTLKPPL